MGREGWLGPKAGVCTRVRATVHLLAFVFR